MLKMSRFAVLTFSCFILFGVSSLARALTISPPRQSLIVDPGNTGTALVTVQNNTTNTVHIVGEVDAFRIDEKTGRAIFGMTDEAKEWVDTSKASLYLPPKVEGNLIFKITVPRDAKPGGHYLGLFVSDNSKGNGIGIGSRVGSLLFFYVGGIVHENLTRVSFAPTAEWYKKGPIEFVIRLKNNGSIHIVPKGAVSIQNSRGRIIKTLEVNLENRKILPGGEWSESYIFESPEWRDIGKIQAIANLQYGIGNKERLSDIATSWYLPWSAVLFAGLCFFAFVFLCWKLFRMNKKQ